MLKNSYSCFTERVFNLPSLKDLKFGRILFTVTMQSHPVQTCSKLLRKIRSLHVLDESLLEGIKQHSLQSLFSHFVFQTEQSFSLQQLLMAARNNYGTGHWNRKEANSLPVFSMFFLLYTQFRKRITWAGRRSAHKKSDLKCMGKLDSRKAEGANCWEKYEKY